jgi:mono/diheme cytochrome c family protein
VVGKRLLVVRIRDAVALSLGVSVFLLSCPSSSPPGGHAPPVADSFNPVLAEQGRRLFNLKACNLCHSADGSPGTGPTLMGVARRSDRRTLLEWCSDPDLIYQREGRRPMHRGFAPMPRQNVAPGEAEALAEYLLSLTPPSGR